MQAKITMEIDAKVRAPAVSTDFDSLGMFCLQGKLHQQIVLAFSDQYGPITRISSVSVFAGAGGTSVMIIIRVTMVIFFQHRTVTMTSFCSFPHQQHAS